MSANDPALVRVSPINWIEGPDDNVGEPTVSLLPDPSFLWQIFRRNMWMMLAIVALVFAPLAWFINKIPPVYAATASILIEPSADLVRTTAPGQRTGIANADEVDTEIRLIGSKLVAERAADIYARTTAVQNGQTLDGEQLTQLARRIQGSTRVTRAGQTRIADVNGISGDPEFAALAANLVAEAYLSSQIEAKTSETDASAAFINARLKELERNALNTQAALDNYKAESGLVNAQGSTSAEQEVSTLNQQLASARADLAQQTGRLNAAKTQLQSGGGGQDVGAALGSSTVVSLRQQEASVSARLAALSQRYGPRHPERQQAEAEIADIRSRIEQEITRILSSLQADVDAAQSRVDSLQRSRSRAQRSLENNSLAQAGLNSRQQRADAAKAIYESFLQRSQETGALRDTALPDAVISATADVPTVPVGPRYKILTAAAMILALGLAFAAMLLREYLRRGVQTKRDVERRLRLRYAGAIPTVKSTIGWWKARRVTPHEYALDNPQSIFAESFRAIRAFLLLSPGNKPRSIAVCSALPAEGKTTTTLCLSLTTAAEGVKTLLIDADLRRRGTSRLLGYYAPKDIYDAMTGRAEIAECIYIEPRTGLHVLGSNASPDGHANPLQEDAIKALLAKLRTEYDVVIIDTAPLLGVADGRIIATAADRVLLVTRWKKTSMRAIEAVTSMLQNTKAKVTGLALTQVNIKKYASTGDSDVYAYTKQFKGYYTN